MLRSALPVAVALASCAAVAAVAATVPPAYPRAGTVDGPDAGQPYEAESLFGTRRDVRADEARLLLRPLWERSLTGAGVRVAIVDTGVDPDHPDLAGAISLWVDVAGDALGTRHAAPYDDHGHGTHVAGIIAGRGHAQLNPFHLYFPTGLTGLAPGVDLLVAKAMRHDGRGSDADVAAAILWALDPDGDGNFSDGAHVINLSVGIDPGDASSHALDFTGTDTRRAVNFAILRGVVVVASSGNDGGARVVEPGDAPRVITVGAVDADGRLARFTNTGDGLDVLAPGVLASAYPRALDRVDYAADGYAALAGTSMAAPVVTGLVALAIEGSPTLGAKGPDRDYGPKVDAIETLIKSHARPAPAGDDGRTTGAGVIDYRATLAALGVGHGPVWWTATAALATAALAAAAASGFVAAGLRRKRTQSAAGSGGRA